MQSACLLRVSPDRRFYLPLDVVVFRLDFANVHSLPSERETQTQLCELFSSVLRSRDSGSEDRFYYSPESELQPGHLRVEELTFCFFGLAVFNPSWIDFGSTKPPFSQIPSNSRSRLVFASVPKNVVCKKQFPRFDHVYSIRTSFSLPADSYLPPSYRGTNVSVCYFLSIEVTFLDSDAVKETHCMRVPLKIVNPAASFHKVYVTGAIRALEWTFFQGPDSNSQEEDESSEPENRLSFESGQMMSLEQRGEDSIVTRFAFQGISRQLESRQSRRFLIQFRGRDVGLLHMEKMGYVLRERVRGVFLLTTGGSGSDSTIACRSLNLRLCCEEIVRSDLLKLDPKEYERSLSLNVVNETSFDAKNLVEIPFDFSLSHGEMSAPNFRTDLFRMQWVLVFVFLLNVSRENSEEFVWRLPLVVFSSPRRERTKSTSWYFLAES